MVHAALNETGLCIGVSYLSQIEVAENLVYLPDGWNEDFLWRKWSGEWSADKFPPPIPTPSPSLADEIAALKAQNAEIIFSLVANDLI